MDPFEEVARNDRNKEEINKNKCLDAAKILFQEIRNIGSPMHETINNELLRAKENQRGFKNISVAQSKIPIALHNSLDTLIGCYSNYEYIIDSEFSKVSKYLRFVGIDHKIPSLLVEYDKYGKKEFGHDGC